MTSKDLYRKIKSPVKKAVNRLARGNSRFDSFYSSIIRKKRQNTFDRFAALPVDERLVVLESFMGRKYADSPKALYEYMLSDERFSDCRFVWCFRGQARSDFAYLADDPRTETVVWGSDEYYRTYAQAGIWIANTRIPESIKKKDGQIYLQCWHGTPLKKLGVDIPAPPEELETTRRVLHKDTERYSYLISPSEYFTEKMTSALDLAATGKEGAVIETGYPRNDAIVVHTDEDEKRVRRDLGISEGSKVILYAPTYREDNRKNDYEYSEPLNLDSFINSLPEDHVILFRAHYYIPDRFDFERYRGRILDVSAYPEVNDLYIISDILVTDYSSVFFDFGILERPVIFYMYDLDHYRDELRGLYLKTEELPGPVVTSQEELEETIASVESWSRTDEQHDRWDAFRDRFTYLEDGKAAERVISAVLQGQKEINKNKY